MRSWVRRLLALLVSVLNTALAENSPPDFSRGLIPHACGLRAVQVSKVVVIRAGLGVRLRRSVLWLLLTLRVPLDQAAD